VARGKLVERLLGASAAPVICVVAPPGYGKTTLLAQWAQGKGDRVGWLTVDQRDNDPVVLLTYLCVALDRVESLDPGVFAALAVPGASVTATVMPRLASAVAAMTGPVTLVLDNLEALDNLACLDAVAEVAAHLPTWSQLALAARTTPRLPAALLAAPGRVVTVGTDQLRMEQEEARALLAGAGVQIGEAETADIVGWTEGWPVGLYLAALAHRLGPARGPQPDTAAVFRGDDRFMADYLQVELLSRMPSGQVSFLTRTAVLERLCGPLCDAVLDTTGSADRLLSLAASNLLLIPLDKQDKWYRYHHLFRDLLHAQLRRDTPDLVPQLHLRAAAWYEANGLAEEAIDHAQAAGDVDRVARLVAGLARPVYASGRVDTSLRWVGWFEDQGLLDHYPQVAVQGALLHILVGQPAAADRCAETAARGAAKAETPSDRDMVDTLLALLRAYLCRDGVERMRADAAFALERLTSDSPWRAGALVLEGMAQLLAGRADRADRILMEAAEVGTHLGALPAVSAALAERCILAMERQAWAQAGALAERAIAAIEAGQLADYIMSPIVHAVAARVAGHGGDLVGAHQHLARAARLRPLLTYAIPQFAVQTRLELAGAYLALGDAAGARVVLREAQDVLRRRPGLGILTRQAADLRSQVLQVQGALLGASALSASELRVLPLLRTNLTYREVGERLYLSQHTAKAHAQSIYRKLGVSSRSQAVERAQQFGLLGGSLPLAP
jgi:LuxR family maltose regulon positive regulatory protein